MGARKPHPRIFDDTLARVGVDAADAAAVVFVGDSWGPDVAGPREHGMRPVYVERPGHWPDPTAPDDPAALGVPVVEDLRGVLEEVQQ